MNRFSLKKAAMLFSAAALVASSVGAQGFSQQWVNLYDGQGSGADYATVVKTDGTGNVIVGGATQIGYEFAFLTIKYDASGAKLWQTTYYLGQGWSADRITDMAIDAAGNIYVTGISVGIDGGSQNFDIATVKYSPEGYELWTSRYRGPANGYDEPASIKVDAAGNVYVAGRSTYVAGQETGIVMLKYNADGTLAWQNSYKTSGCRDVAFDCAVDAAGNSYVTGNTYNTATFVSTYTTIKYNAAGAQEWVALSPEASGQQQARSIQIDALGNVIIGGNNGLFKYNAAGVQQWTVPGYAAPIKLDQAGNVYAVGSDGNIIIKKILADGTPSWDLPYTFPVGLQGIARAIEVDALGKIYAAGSVYNNNNGERNALAIQLDNNGSQLWEATYSGPVKYEDEFAGMALDNAGNVIVTGKITTATWSNDIVTIKYKATDLTAPVISGAADITVEATGPATGVAQPTVTAVDNIDGSVPVSVTWPAAFALGATPVTFTATDAAGNTASTTITVTVTDQTAPVPTVTPLPALVGDCSVTVSDAPTASDLVSGLITGTSSHALPVTYDVQGTYTIVWSYSDGNGNVSTQTQSVVVSDLTAPVISNVPAPVTVPATSESGATVSLTMPTAADNCSQATVTSNAPAIFPVGTTTVTFTATDAAGNTATATTTVTVTPLPTDYVFDGYQQPINPDGSSIFKLGSTVPVKFIATANGVPVSTIVARIYVTKLTNSVLGTEIEATSTSAATTGNLYLYSDGQYIFNLGTKTLSKGTWRIRTELDNGTSQTVDISLK